LTGKPAAAAFATNAELRRPLDPVPNAVPIAGEYMLSWLYQDEVLYLELVYVAGSWFRASVSGIPAKNAW
jgi:hypothetical protein